MPGRLIAIEKLGMAPKPNSPGVQMTVYKIMLSEPGIIKMLRNTEENKNNESIQKLADMTGNDVEFNWKATDEKVDEILDQFKKAPTLMLGALIISRSKKTDDMCTMCKDTEEYKIFEIFNGCHKVPGMEDMGCANWCWFNLP